MRIFISALLLALTGNKKDSECTGEELTNSYIPAGLQVLSHFLTQMKNATTASAEGRHPDPPPTAPVIEVTYLTSQVGSIRKLLGLASILEKEAKLQFLSRCQGFTNDVLIHLEISSKLSASGQLQYILKKIAEGRIEMADTKTRIQKILMCLENKDSDLNADLKGVEALAYLSLT